MTATEILGGGDVRDTGEQERSAAETAQVTWAQVDDGFYVASRAGTFLGCIDVRSDGRFSALDGRTRPIRTCHHLSEAMRAVMDAAAEEAGA